MMRFLMSTAAVVALLAAPVAANAATAVTKPVAAKTTKPAKPVMKASSRSGKTMAKPARARDSGAAAVDSLNDQALARAKAGQ